MPDKPEVTKADLPELIRDAFRHDFDPGDYESLKWLRSKIEPYERKWGIYVSKTLDQIYHGLYERDYFQMPYASKVQIPTDDPMPMMTDIEVATFERKRFETPKGDLDTAKVRHAAEQFCIRQMEMLL